MAKLAELHREHGSIGPLLFGIKYHREIEDGPDSPDTLAKLAFDSKSYGSDIYDGMRLSAHVVLRDGSK